VAGLGGLDVRGEGSEQMGRKVLLGKERRGRTVSEPGYGIVAS
jgi:hypothetical protein